MVTLIARCPFCDHTIRTTLTVGQRIVCPQCQATLTETCPDFDQPDEATRCIACPSTELFVRKDFSQQWGLGIVITGFVASTVAYYYHRVLLSFGILFASALIDVLLYVLVGNLLECYRCHAQYRGLASLEGHDRFALEIHEKYRQQAARMKTANTSPRPDGSSSVTRPG